MKEMNTLTFPNGNTYEIVDKLAREQIKNSSAIEKISGLSNFPENGNEKTLYIDTSNNKQYYWNGSAYVALSFGSDSINATIVSYSTDKSHISENTVQGALDIALGLTLPKLNVNVLSGSQVTISKDDILIRGTAANGKASFTVPSLGTWNVTAELNGESTNGTININAIGSEFNLTLAYFSATIKVTAVEGATVKAVSDGREFTATAASNGVAIVTVKKSGTYTVSAVKNNVNSNTQSVSVTTSGSSYNATVSFITLTLTAPVSSTVTISHSNGTTITDTGLGAAKVYFLNSTGVWNLRAVSGSESTSDSINISSYTNYSAELAFVKIYGVRWTKTSDSSMTRTDDATGWVDPVPYMAGMSASACSSPFDNCYPWKDMKVVEDSQAGTMVSIPKYWFKITNTSSEFKLQIADKAVAGFMVSPAHMDRGDSKGERDIVYVGRYHCGSSAYKSVAGQSPMVNITRSTARTSIHNLGSTIWQTDLTMRQTIQMLYIVEFAHWNSQTKIGYGCGNNSAVQATGAAASMPYHTGTMQSNRTTYGVGVQYRYIEGLWDNCYDWMDGCYYTSNGLNVIKNPANFSDSANGTLVGKPTGGWIKDWAVSTVSGYEWVLYSSTGGGSDNTYVPDYWGFNGSGPCLYSGGDVSQGLLRGMFYVGCSSASDAYSYRGCRAMKLP